MNDNDTKQCPFCAETIKAEAVKCRYCGSALKTGQSTPRSARGHWLRVNEGKRVAGVCTGLAQEFNAPQLVLPLRLFFVITSFLSGFGIILYIVLWLLMTSPEDVPDTVRPAAAPQEIPPASVRGVNGLDVLTGIMLIGLGILLLMAVSGGGSVPGLNLFHHMGHMRVLNPLELLPGLVPILFIVGLITIILGSVRILRLLVGCGLVLLAIVMVPLLRLANVNWSFLLPLLMGIGIVMVIVGGIKLIFGSRPRHEGY